MKIALGMIVKELNNVDKIKEFIDNALKYGHEINSIIIACVEVTDHKLVKKLEEWANVHIIYINKDYETYEELRRRGVSKEAISTILIYDGLSGDKAVPYGINRNNVLVKSMLIGIDYLFYIDYDVCPLILKGTYNDYEWVEVDFFGSHMEYLLRPSVTITTSDYSGYNIIPPMEFDALECSLLGIQKGKFIDFISKSCIHKCFIPGRVECRQPFIASKILGGNVGIKVKDMLDLYPFFSTYYEYKGERYLTRGEDTILQININDYENKRLVDIDLLIFHDTFGNFPEVPNIKTDKRINDRFYNACTGWIGRNPLLNWLNGEDHKEMFEFQYENLKKGCKNISDYTGDKRYLELPDMLKASYMQLDIYISRYEDFQKSWKEMVKKLQ
jgi:hypothetical protein